jgi:aspartate-semialdehyde dehydrogenase
MRLSLVGASGLVGREMIKVLEEHQLKIDAFYPVASAASVGKMVTLNGKEYPLMGMEEAIAMKPDIAIFSAGGNVSLEWAPKFAEAGCKVVDNSSAWRMNPANKLIIPEVNGNELEESDMIIANPNCSTIQLLMVLAPIHQRYGIKRVVVSTYQSVTGTGKEALEQMNNERADIQGKMVYHYRIDKNCIPHCDVFGDNGYTKEEMKLVNETHKILDPAIKLTATAVRVPVMGGHSEAVNIETKSPFEIGDIRKLLASTDGVTLQDNPDVNLYPMPFYSKGKDEVFVGRIRKDESQDNTLNCWIVADNLRKGAATNAIQIVSYLDEKGWVGNPLLKNA